MSNTCELHCADRRTPLLAAGLLGVLGVLGVLGACAGKQAPPAVQAAPAPPMTPVVTLQDLMLSMVDVAADGVWGAAGSTIDAKGVHELTPTNDAEWAQVRSHAVVLVESMNVLMIGNRKVAAREFPSDPQGEALSSAEIQTRIDSQRGTFDGFAAGLRDVALQMLEAVDRRDAEKMIDLGGTIDDVCEACHKTFWYPPKPGTTATN